MNTSFVIQNPISGIKSKSIFGDKTQKLTAELGQIINATITDKTDSRVSLATAEGFKFEADASKIEGNIGDEIQFEVVRSGREGIELKQLRKEAVENLEARRSSTGLKSMLMQNGVSISTEPYSSDDRDMQLKAMEAASKIKRKLRYVSNNSGRSAIKELLASGVSLDKISIDMLSSVMREIEAKPDKQATPAELEAMMNRYLEKNNIPVGEDKTQLLQALRAQGLPATPKNVRALDTVLTKLKEIEDIDDDGIWKLLRDEKPLTVENIYLAKHTSAKLPVDSGKWDMLEAEAGRVFSREGIPKTKETTEAAKFLVERELPVTAENIDKLIFLKNLEDGLDTRRVLFHAAGRIKQDRVVADVNLYQEDTEAVYNNIMADIPFITASHMEFLLKRQPEPTLNQACNTLKYRVAEAPVSEAAAAAHDKLLEIRRKLTYEAAGRLISNKVDISRMKLDEAIAALDSLSADYSRNLRSMEAPVTPENISRMEEIYTKLGELTPGTNHMFASLLSKTIPFTINAAYDAVSAGRLQAGYDQFATVAAPQYGDRFSKIRDEIAPFLKARDIPATDSNIKAAGILIKTNIPVTDTNITEIRLIDMKISGIQSRLHPNIAAAMIKEKRNPLNMHVDDIINYIDGFEEDYGESPGDKLLEHIRALDDQKTLSQEERSSMMEIYRALNTICREQSAGIGLTLKYGSNLTLDNLLTDAKNYQRLRGDVSMREMTEYELNSMVADELARKASPALVKRLADNPKMPLDEALEIMAHEDVSEARIDRVQERINAAANLSTETLARLQSAEIPATVANLHAMYFLENTGIGKALNKLYKLLGDELPDIPDGDLTELKEGRSADEILEGIGEGLEDIIERDSSLLDELILIQNAVKVQRFIGRREPRVSLPVRLHSGIADLNMLVLNEDVAFRDTAEVLLSLDTPNLGRVSILASREGTDVRLEISGDNPEALEENRDALEEYLMEAGFYPKDIVFTNKFPL